MTERREVDQMGGVRRIKKIREDKAQKEVLKARSEVERRQQDLKRSKNSLNEFKNSKNEKTNNLFMAIHGKTVSLKEIQRYNGALAALEEEQQQLAGKVDEDRSGVSDAERSLVEARDHHKIQAKNHRKIQEVHEYLEGQFKVKEAKREEKTLEDDFVFKDKKK